MDSFPENRDSLRLISAGLIIYFTYTINVTDWASNDNIFKFKRLYLSKLSY